MKDLVHLLLMLFVIFAYVIAVTTAIEISVRKHESRLSDNGRTDQLLQIPDH